MKLGCLNFSGAFQRSNKAPIQGIESIRQWRAESESGKIVYLLMPKSWSKYSDQRPLKLYFKFCFRNNFWFVYYNVNSLIEAIEDCFE